CARRSRVTTGFPVATTFDYW
nr:immunoglobulin heavy chain junction region [Macaca mulatta]